METPINIKKENENSDWYDKFLEDFDYQTSKPGDLLKGTIIALGEEGILVDIGLKRDAVVSPRDLDLIAKNRVDAHSVGDEVLVVVLNKPLGDQDLQVSLSKGIEYQSWQKAEQYLRDKEILELEIIGQNRGGLLVNFETLNGFLPFSQVPEMRSARSSRAAEKIKRDLVGTTMEMQIIEVVRERNRLIFSALAAQQDKRRARIAKLEKGQILQGKVVNIVDFGAFVNLDGVDGLVHVSQLDWNKVKHPSEVLKVGEEIQVKVTNIDIERERISLSRKALLPSPWDTINTTYQAGNYIEGIVKRVVKFGAFVELPSGIEGLIHISQLGYSASQNPQDAVKRGESVLVRILNIDAENKRIALSMRQVPIERQIAWAMENLPSPSDVEPMKETEPSTPEKDLAGGSVVPQTDLPPVEETSEIDSKVPDITNVDPPPFNSPSVEEIGSPINQSEPSS